MFKNWVQISRFLTAAKITYRHTHLYIDEHYCRLSLCLSVCLSSICNVSSPYSACWNYRQFFFAVWYLGHPLTFTENFTEIVPGNPAVGGFKRKRGSEIAIFDNWNAITPKRCKIGGMFALITNRTSYMSFRLVPKSVTSNDLERRNGLYFALFYRIW